MDSDIPAMNKKLNEIRENLTNIKNFSLYGSLQNYTRYVFKIYQKIYSLNYYRKFNL